MDYGILANQPVVLDNGSGLLKAGIAGQDFPKVVTPALVGRPKHSRVMAGGLDGDVFVGEKAYEHRGIMRLSYPIRHGIVKNWSDMELLWQHVYEQDLSIASEEHPVLLTEAPLNPKSNRETAAQVFFETFNVPALYISVQAVLALYASGKITGLVLDVGEGVTHCVPVYQGFAISNAILRTDVAGSSVTDFLQLLLRKQGVKLTSSSEREIVREIKEQYCHLSTESVLSEKQAVEAEKTVVKLPDGHRVELGIELSRAPELLFRPDLVGSEEIGCQHILANSVGHADCDLRSQLYKNIYLSGGTTLLRGFGNRLLQELKTLAPTNVKLRIVAPPDRKLSTWIGGSILAGLSSFSKLWVTAEEWQERPYIIHTKCK